MRSATEKMKKMNARLPLILLAAIFCGAFSPLFSQLKNFDDRVSIRADAPKKAAGRAGFRLIFEDEFEKKGFDPTVWDVSTSRHSDDVPCGFYASDFMLDQARAGEGFARLGFEKATAENSDCPLGEGGCERGAAAEIKTFQWRDGDFDPPHRVRFPNYEFPVGSFVEIRAKIPDPKCNAGAAFWLYGGNQEIDVFETSADKKINFTSGYFSDRTIDGKLIGCYERYKKRGRRRPLPAKSSNMRLTVIDEKTNRKIELTKHFVHYAVHFDADSIRYYIDDKNFFNWALTDFDFRGGKLTEMKPKSIRLSTGQITGGGHQPCRVGCPSEMLVDYVRVYFPAEKRAVDWLQKPDTLAASEAGCFKAQYLGGVRYEWSSDFFDFEFDGWPFAVRSNVWARLRAGLPTGRAYPLRATMTFPDGSSEKLETEVFVR